MCARNGSHFGTHGLARQPGPPPDVTISPIILSGTGSVLRRRIGKHEHGECKKDKYERQQPENRFPPGNRPRELEVIRRPRLGELGLIASFIGKLARTLGNRRSPRKPEFLRLTTCLICDSDISQLSLLLSTLILHLSAPAVKPLRQLRFGVIRRTGHLQKRSLALPFEGEGAGGLVDIRKNG